MAGKSGMKPMMPKEHKQMHGGSKMPPKGMPKKGR